MFPIIGTAFKRRPPSESWGFRGAACQYFVRCFYLKFNRNQITISHAITRSLAVALSRSW